jgi:hypothetical protein
MNPEKQRTPLADILQFSIVTSIRHRRIRALVCVTRYSTAAGRSLIFGSLRSGRFLSPRTDPGVLRKHEGSARVVSPVVHAAISFQVKSLGFVRSGHQATKRKSF